MKIYNILNINDDFENLSSFELIMEKDKKKIIKYIKILKFCGKGSYGVVYKCLFDDKICAIKLSKNEKSNTLYKRYKSLREKLDRKLIKIYYAGELINNDDYEYYCIQEYGGMNLKEYIKKKSVKNIKNIVSQLFDIVENIKTNRLLLPDFKLSNLLINDKDIIKVADIYMECDEYKPCINCSIIRTYSIIEISNYMYEDSDYNYSYIYALFCFGLINILCQNSLSGYCSILSKKYNIEDDVKNITTLLQYGCYKTMNIKNDEKINKYLKNRKFDIDIKHFYIDFLELIKIKKEYQDFINYYDFITIINNSLIPIPNYRTIDMIYDIINNTKYYL